MEEPERRNGPRIPVRSNRRTMFVRMSAMNGDKLPQLREVEKPEFSNRTRHFNGLVRSHMWKDVQLMYKEHVIALNKVKRGQELVFKTLCRVTRDKRHAQREEYQRRQEEGRTKVTSERILNLMRKGVQKFRENVKRKRKQKAEDERRSLMFHQNRADRRDSLFLVKGSHRGSLLPRDDGVNSEIELIKKFNLQLQQSMGRDITMGDEDQSISETNEESNKQTDKQTLEASESADHRKDKYVSRSHSAERNREKKPLYTVQTAENRARFGTSILDTEPSDYRGENADGSKSVDKMGLLPVKAVEVSKDTEHQTRLKRSGSFRVSSSKSVRRKRSSKKSDSNSSNLEPLASSSRQVSFAVDKENEMPNPERNEDKKELKKHSTSSSRRKSVFEPPDPEEEINEKDFGWFTFGNPQMNESYFSNSEKESTFLSRTSSESRPAIEKQKSVVSRASSDTEASKRNSLRNSLPSIRRRKITRVGDPPLIRSLRDSVDERKTSRTEVMEAVKDEERKQEQDHLDHVKSADTENRKQDPRLIKKKDDTEFTDRSFNKNGTDFAVWYPVSRKEKKTFFLEPLKNAKKKHTVQFEESDKKMTDEATIKRKNANKQATGKQYTDLDEEISPNMAWILKLEEKYKKSRQARILDKEEVHQYKLISHNKLEGELVPKKIDRFIPPSHKELYLQKKLERKNQEDILNQRIKIGEFFNTISMEFAENKAFTGELVVPKASTPLSVHSVTSSELSGPKESKYPFDVFTNEQIRQADKSGAGDSLKKCRYIRRKGNSTASQGPRGGRRMSMWDLQDPSKLKITKSYA